MSGKRSRDKGLRRERELCTRLLERGAIVARRIPQSGAADGFPGDVEALWTDGSWSLHECKANFCGSLFKVADILDHLAVNAPEKYAWFEFNNCIDRRGWTDTRRDSM